MFNIFKKHTHKIAARLLLYLLLFSGVVTLIITAIQLYIEYQRDIEGIEDQFIRIEKIFQKPLARSLWFFNERSLRLQLEGISNLRDIEYLELIGEKDVFIAVGKKISKSTVANELPLIYKGNSFEREIGRLKIVASLTSVYSRLFKRMITILISQGIKTFLVSTFIFFIVHYLIIKHLSFLSTYLKNMKAGKPSSILRLRRNQSSSDDELDQMVLSINDMAERQHKTFEEIEQIIKQRTKALKESEKKYRDLVDKTDTGFVVVNTQGVVLEINEPYLKMVGAKHKKNVLGHSVIEWTAPESQKQNERALILCAEQGAIKDLEVVYLGFDKKRRNILINATMQESHDGTRLTALCRDISERKTAEEEKEKLQLQLQQAAKMQAVGTLAGGVAHEFNNLLGVIMGSTEMARDEVLPDSFARGQLDRVLKASFRAKDLVKQILTFSRQKFIQKTTVPLNLASSVRETLDLIKSSIPTSIDININLANDCNPTLADSSEISQVMMNLCSNAIRAMEEKGIITISLEQLDLNKKKDAKIFGLETGQYLKLSVSDTGDGIDADIKQRVFEPFFTTAEVGQGTGMGLATVLGIMESYGGIITIDSELGKGTTFHLYFPTTEEKTQDNESFLPTNNKELGHILTGTERILFIDDEEMYADTGKDILDSLGYSVTAKKDSREALEAFLAAPNDFDLVITDQIMPHLSGDDLTKEFLSIRPDIPIILCTGYSSQMDEDKAQSIGIKEFILKPIVKIDIAKLIRKVLDEK